MKSSVCLYPLLLCGAADGFTTVSKAVFDSRKAWLRPTEVTLPNPAFFHASVLGADSSTTNDADDDADVGAHHPATDVSGPCNKWMWIATPTALALLTAYPVEAADVVPSALWAYGHYLSMILTMGSLVAERVLLKPQMSSDEEKAVRAADLLYVASLVFLIVSGAERAAEFGKGFDFYSHEILFWLKMSFVGVLLGCSLFPSITLYRRGNNAPPMSEKLVKRMTSVINAEISGVVTIPLLATFMARGVTYTNDFPWPVGVVLAVAASGGACYYYGSQALKWEEEVDDA